MAYIIRVNMHDLNTQREAVSEEYQLLGGRGLIAKIMNNEVPPTCEPWGRYNKFIVATGFFSGTGAVASSRISVGGKSPLTNGIKEANAGGVAGHKLGRLGVKAIIIEGQPKEKGIYVLRIDKEGEELIEANPLAGLGNYALVEKLKAQYGEQFGIMSVGKAGEMQFANSTIAVTDAEGKPCRHAARGGMGSVMGSRGIKAIVIDDSHTARASIKDEKAFQEIVQEHAKILLDDKGLILLVRTYGIAGAININNEMGALPTRNFREGKFEGLEKITGERMAELRKTRGGKMHACMPTCVVGCSPIFHNEHGEYVTSGFEYESHAMLGSNLGIDDLDAIAEMDRLCDDYGLDTIETGSTLAVAAEAGLMAFGDSQKAKELINEIGRATILGRVLGQGVVTAAKVLGVNRVAAVKGQAMPAHEPRIFKVTGVTMATSPMGADHTAGMVFDASIPIEEVVALSKNAQILCALIDSTGCCQIAHGLTGVSIVQRLFNAKYGLELTESDVLEIGQKALEEEKKFNLAAGITAAQNVLPEFFFQEPIPPTNANLGIPAEELVKMS